MHLIKFKDVQSNLSLCKIQVGTVMHGLNFYNNRKIKNQHLNQANKQTLFSGTSTNEADLYQYKALSDDVDKPSTITPPILLQNYDLLQISVCKSHPLKNSETL